ncbi:MAG: IMPACT family protein [Christensenellales bacterium]|jgi:uncharacterized YigZ family protein
MITLKGTSETSIIIKKSRFLGLACRIDDEQQAQTILMQRRKQYYNATHHCYAFRLENGQMRYSDDGEPQGTAGLPMLEVIKSLGLSDVLVICTRYFGGTLLGSGGLVRAYTKSTSDTLDAAQKVTLIPGSIYECRFSYATWARAEKSLSEAGYIIDNILFSDDVVARICVAGGNEGQFEDFITNVSLGKTIPLPLGQRLIEHSVTRGSKDS